MTIDESNDQVEELNHRQVYYHAFYHDRASIAELKTWVNRVHDQLRSDGYLLRGEIEQIRGHWSYWKRFKQMPLEYDCVPPPECWSELLGDEPGSLNVWIEATELREQLERLIVAAAVLLHSSERDELLNDKKFAWAALGELAESKTRQRSLHHAGGGQVEPGAVQQISAATVVCSEDEWSEYRRPSDWQVVLKECNLANSNTSWRTFRDEYQAQKLSSQWRYRFKLSELRRAGVKVPEATETR